MTHRAGMPTEPVHFANLADWLEENWGLDTPIAEVLKDLRVRSNVQDEPDEEALAEDASGQRKLIQVPRAIRRELVGTGQHKGLTGRDTAVTSLPTRDGSFAVRQSLVTSLSTRFPRVDVMGEIAKMRTWLEGNPRSRKTERGMRRFVSGWVVRAAERVGQGRPGGAQPAGTPRVVGINGDGTLRYG